MVIVETPDGARLRYRLARSRGSRGGWRLVHRYGSYELLAMIESGWRVVLADTDTDRRRLKSVFRMRPPRADAPNSAGTVRPALM
jgi:hypothetical protein